MDRSWAGCWDWDSYPQLVLLAAATLRMAPPGLVHDAVIVGWLCAWAWGLWSLREEGNGLAP